MIDKVTILTAFRARLTSDPTLMGIVGGVYQQRVPGTHDWSEPALEFGEQADTEDRSGLAYGQQGADMLIRLMAHDQGSQPGVISTDTLYAALRQADTVLRAAPFTSGGTWYFTRDSSIPVTVIEDESLVYHWQGGNLYRLRVVE